MKRVHKVVKAILLSMIGLAGFFSCTHVYPTTEIDSFDVTAEAYHGVNILTWDAVKDAASYSVYRTTDGQREQVLSQYQNNNFYIDTEIKQGTEYEYRVLAHPVNTVVHDSSEEEVDVETAETWPPVNTSFLDLAQYDDDDDFWGETLSEGSISAELIASSGSNVSVRFPVKPYAKYTVKIGQIGGAALNDNNAIDAYKTILGFDYDQNQYATVDIPALFPGEKEITVVAEPFSPRYTSSTVQSYSTVTINDISKLAYAVDGNIVDATWTNCDPYNTDPYYNAGIAKVRVRFSPATLNGTMFAANDYTIYRAILNSKGELEGGREYSSITKLGSPSKDIDASTPSKTVYYYDDTIDLPSVADISTVKYYVVLNYEGKIKTACTELYAPNSGGDNDWNYRPDNNVRIKNLTLNENGHLTVDVHADYFIDPQFTYGYFNSYNEAITAVERELPNEVSLSPDYQSDYYSGTSSGSLTSNGIYDYYAFRFVNKTLYGTEVVRKVIAQVNSTYSDEYGSVYYLDIRDGREEVDGYGYDGNAYIYNATNSDDASSITLSFAASYNNAARYLIYRKISETPDSADGYNLDGFERIASIDCKLGDDPYRNYSDKISPAGCYVTYKIVAIPRYSALSPNNITYDYARTYFLVAPLLDSNVSENILRWNRVDNATEYRIYRATSREELYKKNIGENEFITYSNTFTAPTTYDSYYYAVRAYNSNYGYSALSNIVTVSSSTAE